MRIVPQTILDLKWSFLPPSLGQKQILTVGSSDQTLQLKGHPNAFCSLSTMISVSKLQKQRCQFVYGKLSSHRKTLDAFETKRCTKLCWWWNCNFWVANSNAWKPAIWLVGKLLSYSSKYQSRYIGWNTLWFNAAAIKIQISESSTVSGLKLTLGWVPAILGLNLFLHPTQSSRWWAFRSWQDFNLGWWSFWKLFSYIYIEKIHKIVRFENFSNLSDFARIDNPEFLRMIFNFQQIYQLE